MWRFELDCEYVQRECHAHCNIAVEWQIQSFYRDASMVNGSTVPHQFQVCMEWFAVLIQLVQSTAPTENKVVPNKRNKIMDDKHWINSDKHL